MAPALISQKKWAPSDKVYVIFHLPPANEVWGKVMFLLASDILFTGGGVYHGGLNPRKGRPSPHTWHFTGYGQQAGGTHPT